MPCTLRCVEQKWLLFLPSRRRAVFVAACVKCQRSVLISAFVIRQLHTIEDWKGVRYKPDFAPLLSPDSFSLSPILAFALYSLPTRRIWYSERRFLNSLWAPQPLACDLLPAFKLSFVIKEINGLSQGNSEEGKFVRKVGEVLLKFRNPHCFLGRGKLLSFFCSQRNESTLSLETTLIEPRSVKLLTSTIVMETILNALAMGIVCCTWSFWCPTQVTNQCPLRRLERVGSEI